ncbi:MAG: TonB-dependent receptor, partial [Aquificota bacterium]
YVGKRKDTDGSKTGYYTVLNTYINMSISKNLIAYLKLNNITDTYYQTVNGYATEGRSLYAGLNLKY